MPGTFEIGMIEVKEFFATLTGSGKGTVLLPISRIYYRMK